MNVIEQQVKELKSESESFKLSAETCKIETSFLLVFFFFIYIIFTCAFLINFFSTANQPGYFDKINLNETDY